MLKKDLFAPVCSPRLGVVALDDLHSATLLHIDGRQVPRPAPDWERWSAAFGPAGLAVARGPRFTDGSHALQAAIAGQGIAIVSLVLVESALKSGLLVRPFDGTLEGECYHFVATRELGERADVVSLREWFRSALN
jgi:LysR family glycine cleavage system transcriptional activator